MMGLALVNDLFKDFWFDWDPKWYTYSRITTDSKPYTVVRDDDKYSIVLNALGIKKDDIVISIDRECGKDYLNISGETKNEVLNKTYSVSGRFAIDGDKVNNIDWTTNDGLLEIVVNLKEIQKSKIKINKR